MTDYTSMARSALYINVIAGVGVMGLVLHPTANSAELGVIAADDAAAALATGLYAVGALGNAVLSAASLWAAKSGAGHEAAAVSLFGGAAYHAMLALAFGRFGASAGMSRAVNVREVVAHSLGAAVCVAGMLSAHKARAEARKASTGANQGPSSKKVSLLGMVALGANTLVEGPMVSAAVLGSDLAGGAPMIAPGLAGATQMLALGQYSAVAAVMAAGCGVGLRAALKGGCAEVATVPLAASGTVHAAVVAAYVLRASAGGVSDANAQTVCAVHVGLGLLSLAGWLWGRKGGDKDRTE